MATVHRLAWNDRGVARLWDEFVFQCPTATFFHRSGWQSILHDVFHHPTYYLFLEDAGKIRGVLPLAHISSLIFGRSLISLPFAVYGGPAAEDETVSSRLEEAACALAQELGVSNLELRNREKRNFDWPSQDIYFTFRRKLFDGSEENLNAIPRKQRAMIRKGIKGKLVSRNDTDPSVFFSLYSDNMHRHGTPPHSKVYFESLMKEFGRDCRILTVSDQLGEPLSSVLSFYFRDEVLPYYAGDSIFARSSAANDFKYWELMSQSISEQVRTFDFGRSKICSGSFSFKKNWGFEPQPLSYEFCLYGRDQIPQNNPANSRFRVLIEAWKKMPNSFTNVVGPHIVRSIG